jgi:hypothetical protein
MAEDASEWKQKGKVWTYLIALAVLVVIVLVVNLVWQAPSRAEEDFKKFLGLPAPVLAGIVFALGAVVFWGGLKVEPEWPEAIGAFLIAGSIAWFEYIIGWNRMDIGGLVVVPYLLPIITFLILLGYAMKRGK